MSRSNPHRVLTIIGARPDAIKMAPLVHRLNQSDQIHQQVCVTGQHRRMLDDALGVFGITPHIDLNVMAPNQDPTDVTRLILLKMRNTLQTWRPDIMLVHGDTTTAFSSALSAYLQRVAVGHVEAGLRTGHRYAPWPEEGNRSLITSLADIHFAPTDCARHHLLKEGVDPSAIVVTGNTVIDALNMALKKLDSSPELSRKMGQRYAYLNRSNRFILVTGHRRETLGDAVEPLCHALIILAKQHPDCQIVYPLHPNPGIRLPIQHYLMGHANIHLIDPIEYIDCVYLMRRAYLILTDSGGIQEEGPSLGTPVLVMRDTTERPEALQSGTVKLVGTHTDGIVREVNHVLHHPETHKKMSTVHSPYGDGTACHAITRALISYMDHRKTNDPVKINQRHPSIH